MRPLWVGAGSGTTPLARALAGHFETTWVAEYGRGYSQRKQAAGDKVWNTPEFVASAAEQARREDAAARLANRRVVGDTNAFATTLWHRRHVGRRSLEVEAVAGRGHCDLYLLTGDEIPFVQDGLRDGEHLSHEMHGWFVEALSAQTVPWRWLRGSHERRLAEAVASVEGLFAKSGWKPRALPVTARTEAT